MTPENLLIPRIKVMKDWPGRRDFEVGQVITLDKTFGDGSPMWELEDCQGKRTYIMAFFKMFPAEFRLIEWWEERLPEEMPEYVKGLKSVRKLISVEYHGGTLDDNKTEYPSILCEGESIWSPIWLFLPATESEYNTFIESKK